MKTIKVLLISVGIFNFLNAGAQELSVGLGDSIYKDRGNGFWYQDGFEHTLDLKTANAEINLDGNILNHLDYDTGYVYLGSVHTQAIATSTDANYDASKNSCRGICLPMSNYVGSGHNQGFVLGLKPVFTISSLKFSLIGGFYFNRNTWTENIHYNSNGQTVSNNNDPHWSRNYYGGASIQYGKCTLKFQVFDNLQDSVQDGPKNIPPIWKSTNSISFNYSFN